MPQQLIFIGGPPGVGKTATCARLYKRLPNSICVDGDDLWCRMNPFRVDETTTAMVEKNVVAVLRHFLEAGFDHVILGWVLHDRAIVDRLLRGLDGLAFSFAWITLVCEESVLRRRWAATHEAGGDEERALVRLRQARALEGTRHLDTTTLAIDDVVRRIAAEIGPIEAVGARAPRVQR